MDLSHSSTACVASLTPAAIAAAGLTVVPGAQLAPMNRCSPRRQVVPRRWSNLLWVLLLGGLTEASLGQVSVAQSSNTVEPPIVQIRQPGVEPVEAGETPAPLPEAVVIPDPPTIPSPSEAAESSTAEGRAAEKAVNDAATEAIEAATEALEKAKELSPESAEAETADSIPSAPTIETPSDRLPDESLDTETISESEATSESETELAETDRVYLANEQISFVPPMGFTPMSPTEIKTKFPGAMPPQYAYGNATRDVSVGVSVSDIPLAPEQLPEVKTFLEEYLETSVPGFQWLEHDFVNLGGQDWIKLEFLSEAPEQRIHNDMYITSLQGKLLGFNFNANLAVDATLRPLLQDSRNSIVVDTTVATDEVE